MKNEPIIIAWDEINGEPDISGCGDIPLILPITCTDRELVAFLREQNGDEEDPDGEWGKDWEGQPNKHGWRCAALKRSDSAAIVEWRSDRNHLAVTTVIWT